MPTLKDLLEIVLTRGIPMVAVYWLLDRPFVMRWFEKARLFIEQQLNLSVSTVKRLTAIALSIVFGLGAFSIYAGLGYDQFPTTFEGWANVVIRLGAVVFAGSQVIHTRDLY